ncbi:MAG: hypothetical protein QF575_08505 [Acidimicrobiales bacterium]|nr:hypothetical protein [Acidimicrobiales bacterium]
MNHSRIAAEVLRFRFGTLDDHAGARRGLPFDVDEAAEVVVACGDPGVDRALRMVGEAWQAAGLDPGAIDHRWAPGDAARLRTVGGAALLDAVDDLVAGLSRCRTHT